ncbi:MAG TPA: hypothetical protein DCK95_11710 [Anaerolineaceae bacterium]|nr:hypothetical protein [Anaerolineaceae bacterium]
MAEIDQVEVLSLKKACIQKLQQAILSGTFIIGERLPSERDLARQLGVSRPVLHEAVVALNEQGLVQIEARRGVFVRDYRKESSIVLINTLLEYEQGDFASTLFTSLIEGRLLIERETARLAAQRCGKEAVDALQVLLARGRSATVECARALTDYDFCFHLEIALASGNQMYPMILNSLRGVHSNLVGRFYQDIYGTNVVEQVLDNHKQLVQAISKGDAPGASEIMAQLLRDGEENINRIFFNT